MPPPRSSASREMLRDRLFAPGSRAAIITSVDKDGRVNAASYATAVRIVHNPVQIAFTTASPATPARTSTRPGVRGRACRRSSAEILEKVRVVGLPFARGVTSWRKPALTALPSSR